ncbi:hypothetical protein C8Q72DRAFT_769834, partial [Fomitopsis betulina]
KLIEMCGKDPSTATAQEMNEFDVRYVLDKKVMTWCNAVCFTHPSLARSIVLMIHYGVASPAGSTERDLQLEDGLSR